MKPFIFIAALALASCTISPSPSKPRTIPSYSNNDLNSGIIAALYDEKHNFKGFSVTDDWVASYNSLAKDYGYLFNPPVEQIHPAGNIVTAQQMTLWLDMKKQPSLGHKPQTFLQKIL